MCFEGFPVSTHERMLSVIEDFYAAALDERLWPTALKNLTDLTGSQASSFWVLDTSASPCLPTFVYINFDPQAIRQYLDGMAALDPTVRYLAANPSQAIVHHDGVLKKERDNRSRDYYDWHDRHIETRFRMVGQAKLGPELQAGVALHRTRKAGRYEVRDVDSFALLHRHLQRALTIGVRVGSLGAMQQVTSQWLDNNRAAILLLDRQKRVIFANRSAETLHSIGDGIRLSSEGIVLARAKENSQLQALIAKALAPNKSADMSTCGSMRISRPSGKRPYGIFVIPTSAQFPVLTVFRPAICVIITDPDRQIQAPIRHFQALFDLTPAEARLATRLAAGDDLRLAAEKLKITYGTARTRLSQLFQKTDCRRQSELVRILMTTFVEH